MAMSSLMRVDCLILLAALTVGPRAFSNGDGAIDNVVTAALAPVEIAFAHQFDFKSGLNGRTYRVKFVVPPSAPPSGGYPVIYVLDGGYFFGTFAEAVQHHAAANEGEPAVVVGITYPLESTANVRRLYDLSPTNPPDKDKVRMKELPLDADYGGAGAFFDVIENEIRPRITKEAAINPDRSILFGWSLGGLFVLHTLFTHPEAFQTYIALSPSIWWDHKILLKEEPGFERRIAGQEISPRVFIGVGGLEQVLPKGPLPGGFTKIEMQRVQREGRMVDNARDLSVRLSGLNGRSGYGFKSHVFKDETHNSVPWAAIEPILDFALPSRAVRSQ
jgi:predicted alpha/beta superfamily hydrolase